MAWRFKASKYKNAAPLEPKLDTHIRDLAIGSYHSCGNFIAASGAFVAFNWDMLGSSLALLPLNTSGRPDKAAIPRIDAHSQLVTDFMFSPFDDGLLATGSQDQTVKLWRIPEAGLTKSLTEAEVTLPEQPRRVETVTWHPASLALLTVGCHTGVRDIIVTAWCLLNLNLFSGFSLGCDSALGGGVAVGGARGPGPGSGLVTPGGESGNPEQGQDTQGV